MRRVPLLRPRRPGGRLAAGCGQCESRADPAVQRRRAAPRRPTAIQAACDGAGPLRGARAGAPGRATRSPRCRARSTPSCATNLKRLGAADLRPHRRRLQGRGGHADADRNAHRHADRDPDAVGDGDGHPDADGDQDVDADRRPRRARPPRRPTRPRRRRPTPRRPSPRTSPMATEQLFADRYKLERRLGVGGMATVQLAFDTRLERNVAVKLLAEHLAEDSSLRVALPARGAGRRAARAPEHRAGLRLRLRRALRAPVHRHGVRRRHVVRRDPARPRADGAARRRRDPHAGVPRARLRAPQRGRAP